MDNLKCKTCGGELILEGSGGMICPYCGSKSFMTDADFRGNEEFRKKLLEYMKAEAENKEINYDNDVFWRCEGEDTYIMSNGQNLNVQYMFKYDYKGCICYLAKETAVYIFDNNIEKSKFVAGLNRLSFPEADNKLNRCFPKIKLDISLKGGKEVIAVFRMPNFFPAELFEPWPSEHLAWVISRMENICCALTYSGIVHGGIDSTSVWINPVTHEGALFGDWRNVRPLQGNSDLVDLRKTAIGLSKNALEPIELYRFLNSAPANNAYDDFANWDIVIEKGFGGHKYIKM